MHLFEWEILSGISMFGTVWCGSLHTLWFTMVLIRC